MHIVLVKLCATWLDSFQYLAKLNTFFISNHLITVDKITNINISSMRKKSPGLFFTKEKVCVSVYLCCSLQEY